MVPKYTTSP